MKVTLTGADGFIGRACDRRLAAASHTVRPLRLRLDFHYANDWLDSQMDALIIAGWGGVSANRREEAPAQVENTVLFSKLLRAARQKPPGVIIGFGSQAELYQTDSAYALAKQDCLAQLSEYGRSTGARWLWLRLFTVYGPEQSAEWFLPQVIRKFLSRELVPMTPGGQRVDWLHVDDAAEAVLAGLDSEAVGEFDVGSGRAVELSEVVSILSALTGFDGAPGLGQLPYRPGQVMRACANPQPYMKATGWRPETGLHDGLREMVQHLKTYG